MTAKVNFYILRGHGKREMYCDNGRLCVCLCVCLAMHFDTTAWIGCRVRIPRCIGLLKKPGKNPSKKPAKTHLKPGIVLFNNIFCSYAHANIPRLCYAPMPLLSGDPQNYSMVHVPH